jgi:hypothetical protein
VDNKFSALGGYRTGFGGVVSRHARLEQPLAVCKFHAADWERKK